MFANHSNSQADWAGPNTLLHKVPLTMGTVSEAAVFSFKRNNMKKLAVI